MKPDGTMPESAIMQRYGMAAIRDDLKTGNDKLLETCEELQIMSSAGAHLMMGGGYSGH